MSEHAGRRYEFLDPWWSTDELDACFHATFLNQLKREVGPTTSCVESRFA
jgi:hypothetical protein